MPRTRKRLPLWTLWPVMISTKIKRTILTWFLTLLTNTIAQPEGNRKAASPIDVLKLLLEQHKVSARELSRILGKDESLGSLILTGRRSITVEHSKMLGEHFNVKPSVFLGLE